MRAKIYVLVLVFALLGVGILPQSSANGFLETFNGAPSTPQPFVANDNWNVVVYSRDNQPGQINEMDAQHGIDCKFDAGQHHHITGATQAAFRCNDHVMTAIDAAGYGAIVLTPNQLLQIGDEIESVVRWDMSTGRTANRDWIDIWITPPADQLTVPLEPWFPALEGTPRRGIHVVMGQYKTQTFFAAEMFDGKTIINLPYSRGLYYESFLTQSFSRRDTFELKLSKTHLSFCMPRYNACWVDTNFPKPLDFSEGLVQFGHHNYTPAKDPGNTPNTWHWDNIAISPARTISFATPDQVRYSPKNPTIALPRPASAGDMLRILARSDWMEASFDGGTSYNRLSSQSSGNRGDIEKTYLVPLSTGVTRVMLRGNGYWGDREWFADFPLVLNTQNSTSPPPSPVASTSPPTGTPTPQPTTTVQPTNTPRPSATAVATTTPRAVTATPIPVTVVPLPSAFSLECIRQSDGSYRCVPK